jgi:hypothetical protein
MMSCDFAERRPVWKKRKKRIPVRFAVLRVVDIKAPFRQHPNPTVLGMNNDAENEERLKNMRDVYFPFLLFFQKCFKTFCTFFVVNKKIQFTPQTENS